MSSARPTRIPYLTADEFGMPRLVDPAAEAPRDKGAGSDGGERGPGSSRKRARRLPSAAELQSGAEPRPSSERLPYERRDRGHSAEAGVDPAPGSDLAQRRRDSSLSSSPRPTRSRPGELAPAEEHGAAAAFASPAADRGPRHRRPEPSEPPSPQHNTRPQPEPRGHPAPLPPDDSMLLPSPPPPSAAYTRSVDRGLPSSAQPSWGGSNRLERTLTYRLLKATSLSELDHLLLAGVGGDDGGGGSARGGRASFRRRGKAGGGGAGPDRSSGGGGGGGGFGSGAEGQAGGGAPNMIHLAAAARQAVLLGGLQRLLDTRALLDRHSLRAAGAMQREREAARQEAEAGQRHEVAGARWTEQQQPQRRHPGAGEAAALAQPEVGVGPGPGAPAAPAPEQPPQGAAAAPPLPLPLRELGDLLWAYGKLRCKPPEQVWRTVVRPLLLDPAAAQQLLGPHGGVPGRGPRAWEEEGDGGTARGRGARGADPPAAAGQELGKLAVGLARMQIDDVEVWRVLARAAAAAAPELPPRALSSVLWAFGSARMAHAPLLSAAVHAVRRDLPQYNGQDLVCVMWALARLAPPPCPRAAAAASEAVGGRESRAAAAVAGARDLLYGDLSDAVRRCLQGESLKPAELTTLLGALDEMAAHAAPASGPGALRAGGAPRRQHDGPNPRLLRVVSQAVRKGMPALQVGALAEAAAAFQRLGHSDAALYRALAHGMAARARHMQPRHVARAAVALQAAGHAEGAVYAKLLEAGQSRLPAFKPSELLAMAELCSRLAAASSGPGGAAAATAGEALDQQQQPRVGADPAAAADVATGPAVVDLQAVHAFLHAAIQQAVATAADPRSGRVGSAAAARGGHAAPDGGRSRADGAGADDAADAHGATADGAAAPARLRLWQWHALLRSALAAGWYDDALAGRALNTVLGELQRLRAAWVPTVRARAAAELAEQRGQQEQPQQQPQGSQGQQAQPRWEGQAQRGPAAGRTQAAAAPAAPAAAAPPGLRVYDPTADAVARVVATAAALRQRHRVDAVAAAAAALAEASREASRAAAPPGRLQAGGVAPLLLLSAEAEADLRQGLAFFAAPLDLLANRSTKAAVHVMCGRLGLELWGDAAGTAGAREGEAREAAR